MITYYELAAQWRRHILQPHQSWKLWAEWLGGVPMPSVKDYHPNMLVTRIRATYGGST